MDQEFMGSLMQMGAVWASLMGIALLLYWPFVVAGMSITTTALTVQAGRSGRSLKHGAARGLLWGAALAFVLLNIVVAHQLLTHFAAS
jgi:hypothetical protein